MINQSSSLSQFNAGRRCVRHLEEDGGAECVLERRPAFQLYYDIYVNLYYWFRVIFIMCLPCIVLIVFNSLLIGAIRTANARRQQLLRTQRAIAMATENDRTTLMLVVVVAIMLIVEFPMIVIFLLVLGSLLRLSIAFIHSCVLLPGLPQCRSPSTIPKESIPSTCALSR